MKKSERASDEKPLEPLNRLPDENAARSEDRERLAVTLEKLARRVRADDGERSFYGWTTSRDFMVVNEQPPMTDERPNTEVEVVRITWKK